MTQQQTFDDLEPFFAEDGVEIYCADSETLAEHIAGLDALVHADPPYGISERTDRRACGRSERAEAANFPPVFGDDTPFEPARWLACRRLILWGGNHYASRLPDASAWLVWDKRDGTTSNDNADCELAWTNLGGPARLFHHLNMGMMRASEHGQPRVHPTQKPVALAKWAIEMAGNDGLIVDPYMGAGSTLIAARSLQRRAIGVECSEAYCEVAVERLRASRDLFVQTYPDTKWCAGCRSTLRVILNVTFNRKNNQPDGLQPFCRECDSKQKIQPEKAWATFRRALINRKRGEESLWTPTAYYRVLGAFVCHHCGGDVREWGGGYWIDQNDPSRGYTIDNALPCCWPCNETKCNKSLAVFQHEMITRLQRHGGRGKVQWQTESPKFARVSHPNLDEYRIRSKQLGLGI